MKRRQLTAAVAVVILAVAVVAVVLARAGSGGSGTYQVRALFDNAGFAVAGEQVRIAGAPVGTITNLSVTKNDLAAVTLSITDHDFTPWYANATCTIRPQSLIAERYVDCMPGNSSRAALARITSGAGTGSHLLPVTQTSSPIDPDLVQDVSQDSVRESLSLILDELGTGLAARGSDLNAVILRANPGLAQTERVFQILAAQDRTLAQLATDANTVLTPLAKARNQLAGFVTAANQTATASAARTAQIQQSIRLLPGFMSELKPLMSDLGYLAQQGTPLMQSLSSSADGINAQFKQIVPFAKQARSALINLGSAAERSRGSLDQSVSLAQQLQALGDAADPSSQELDKLTASLQKTGALQQLMALLFYGAGATNGFDADGHYVRADAQFGSCTAYNPTTTPVSICDANFSGGSDSSDVAAAGTTSAQSPDQQKIDRIAKVAASSAGTGSSGSAGALLGYLLGSESR